MDIIKRVKEYCKKNSLLQRGDRVIIAVSGGPDSTALLHILSSLAGETGFEVAVAHLEHGIRGEESLADSAFVREEAANLGLPCHTRSVVTGNLRKKSESLEEAARRVRYGFFFELCAEKGFTTIATGHTLDDNIETFLFRIATGTGPSGAVGMQSRNGRVVHPLLSVTREEVVAFLRKRDIPYRTDSTNLDRRYPRNRIRYDVVPGLRKVNGRYRENVQRFMDIVGEEDRYMASAAAGALEGLIMDKTGDAVSLSHKAFRTLDPALRRRVILGVKTLLFPDTEGDSGFYIPFEALRYIAEYRGTGSRTLYRKGPLLVRFSYGRLLFEKNLVTPEDKPYLYYVDGTGGPVLIDEIQKKAVFRIRGHVEAFDNSKLYFDYRKLKFPIVIRNRKDGDRIRLQKLGTKKIKSLLIDAKVPGNLRGTVPIIESEGEVVGILLHQFGLANRCAARVMVTDGTDKILECGLAE